MNARAVERLTIVLWKAGGNYLTSAQAGTLAQIIVAAGWGHPNDLTDEQVATICYADHCGEMLGRRDEFRAALARANKGER